MQMSSLLPGTEVVARGLRWEVVYSESAGEQELYRLRCMEGAMRGQELDILTPFEKLEPVASEMDPTKAAQLRHWRVFHQAFLLEQALGPSALLAAQPGRLQVVGYQLVPVMRALRMSRSRLLLADGVGLGKTVEAGLVLAELIARRRAHRILIVSPAGPLLQQWRVEMRERFGLRFRVLDRESLQEIRYANELGANPFNHEALGLISIDFAKQEKVLQDLERTQYDVVVIDEAHHCTRVAGRVVQEDSLRRRLAEVLARQSDNLLLLTATPHDGYDPHFASIIELLDPSLVDGRGSLRGEGYRSHVVRRLKRHIKDPDTGEPMFKERVVEPVAVEFSKSAHPAFSALQEGLLALIAPQLRRAIRQKNYGDVLAFISLLKRSVSTARACRETLETISGRLNELAGKGMEDQKTRKQRLNSMRTYRRRMERFGVLSLDEEQDQAELEADHMAAELSASGVEELQAKLDDLRKEVRRERDRLRRVTGTVDALLELAEIAEDAEAEDPKLEIILEQIQAIRQKEPRANILIYTEYSDSQSTLMEYLEAAQKRKAFTGQIVSICGDDDEKTRSAATGRFQQHNDMVLVSTDATAEGLNLHQRCHNLLHLELPYNPNRLEQRNGRIDRFGQKKNPQVRYLYLAGTFEERLLLRLVAKYEKQRARLTFVPNTLGVFSGDHSPATVKLLEGIVEEEGLLFSRPAPLELTSGDEEDVDSTAYREMLQEVDRAFSSYHKAAKIHEWLGEVGLNADEAAMSEAEQASQRGQYLGAVDLLRFVTDAVKATAGDSGAVQEVSPNIWELRLTTDWTYGLDDIPGYDADSRVLRLTTDMHLTHDPDEQPVGYLGRAHPIVRRALDRVRNILFGSGGEHLDRRVSAARSDAEAPEVLLTYLARLQSGRGREFERVLAVRVSKKGRPKAVADPTEWSHFTEPDRAVPPFSLWDKHFAGWVPLRQEESLASANRTFEALAEAFSKEHREELAAERQELDRWLVVRADGLCGPRYLGTQLKLLEEDGSPEELPAWRMAEQPTERLAGFSTDRTNSITKRREAEGVLKLYKKRCEDLDRRSRLEPPDVRPLGMLMLVPAGEEE